METQAFRLRMTAPLHIGERGVGLEETLAHIPSDTLFGALIVTWQEMAEHRTIVPAISTSFIDKVPLLVASAFPFAGTVYLAPKPLLPLRPVPRTEDESAKKFKKVRWVSATIFRQLVSGITQTALDKLWATGVLLQDNTVWVTAEEAKQIAEFVQPDEDNQVHLWSSMRMPKVTIDRIRNASTFFHVGRLHFAANCGLWCMAKGEMTWLTRMADAIRLLADSGIGGQRSRGNGQFKLEEMDVPALSDANANTATHTVLLSRLAPTTGQMTLLKVPQAHYELVTVGGYNGTPSDRPLVRQQVRLLTEGSVIGAMETSPGQVVNVNPYWDEERAAIAVPETLDAHNPNLPLIPHAVYRYGFGFTIPVQMPRQEAIG